MSIVFLGKLLGAGAVTCYVIACICRFVGGFIKGYFKQ